MSLALCRFVSWPDFPPQHRCAFSSTCPQVRENEGLANELHQLAEKGRAASDDWTTHSTGFKSATFLAAADIAWGERHDFEVAQIGGYMSAQRKRLALTNEELYRFVEMDKYAVMMNIDALIPSHLPTILASIGVSADDLGDVFITPGEEAGTATGAFMVRPNLATCAEIVQRQLFRVWRDSLHHHFRVWRVSLHNQKLPGQAIRTVPASHGCFACTEPAERRAQFHP